MFWVAPPPLVWWHRHSKGGAHLDVAEKGWCRGWHRKWRCAPPQARQCTTVGTITLSGGTGPFQQRAGELELGTATPGRCTAPFFQRAWILGCWPGWHRHPLSGAPTASETSYWMTIGGSPPPPVR